MAKSCLDLPQADKVKQLEQKLSNLEGKCNATDKHLQQLKSQSESRILSLEKKVSEQAAKLNKLINADSTKTIENGMLEKRGSTCLVKCNKGSYPYPSQSFPCSYDYCKEQMPKCIAAKSCKDIAKYVANAGSGVYSVQSNDGTNVYPVYCDMATDRGGWTLAAVVANGDSDNWVYGDADNNFGDVNSLWENSVVLGKVDANTITTAKDFKSPAFNDMKANELLISFKGRPKTNHLQGTQKGLISSDFLSDFADIWIDFFQVSDRDREMIILPGLCALEVVDIIAKILVWTDSGGPFGI